MIQNILDRKGGEVITIRATETVKSAADRMREHGIAAFGREKRRCNQGASYQNATSYKPSRSMGRERFRWRCWTSRPMQ